MSTQLAFRQVLGQRRCELELVDGFAV
ncbi:MAG: hypothetical protein QOJ66_3065, partial [Ilumatobacteraceae bacterium]